MDPLIQLIMWGGFYKICATVGSFFPRYFAYVILSRNVAFIYASFKSAAKPNFSPRSDISFLKALCWSVAE